MVVPEEETKLRAEEYRYDGRFESEKFAPPTESISYSFR
jgi:hypothetical protein